MRHGFPAAVSFRQLEGKDGFIVSADFAPVDDRTGIDAAQLLQRKIFHGVVRVHEKNKGLVSFYDADNACTWYLVEQ